MHALIPPSNFQFLIAVFLVMCWKCSIQYEMHFFFSSSEIVVLDEILIAFGSQYTLCCQVVHSAAQHQSAEMSLRREITELGSLQIRCDVQCQRSGGEVDQNWPSTTSSSPGIRETDTDKFNTRGQNCSSCLDCRSELRHVIRALSEGFNSIYLLSAGLLVYELAFVSAKICSYKNIYHILCVRVFYRFCKRRSEKDIDSFCSVCLQMTTKLCQL